MSQELEPLIAELIAASPGGVPPHPAPRRLLDYRAQRMDEAEAGEVREHLVRCRACAAALVDLGELEEPAADDDDEAGEVADYGTAAAWRALVPRLAEVPPEAVAEDPQGTDFSTKPWWPRLAAVLALAALGLGVWGTNMWSSNNALENRLASFEAPRANAAVIYLDALMRSDAPAPEIFRQDGQVLLFLTPPEQPAAERYRVEIRDAADRLQVAVGGLTPQDLGALRFTLAASSLDRGDHRVLLFEDTGDPEEQNLKDPNLEDLLATYRLEVLEEPLSATAKP